MLSLAKRHARQHHVLTPRVAPALMDTTTYDRPTHQTPSYGGFEVRKAAPTAIVVHSTSNPTHKNTAFAAEAKFLFADKLAGAHYLIGKDGTVVRFFEPRKWAAWHAGQARVDWSNQRSIGIELHHSVGDDFYPAAQLAALGALLASLSALFNIPFGMIETHGQIALPGPYKRKSDPSDWAHADFIRWRNALVQAPVVQRYRVRGVPIHEAPNVTSAVALGDTAILAPGTVIQPDQIKDGWAHVPEGFIDARALEAI